MRRVAGQSYAVTGREGFALSPRERGRLGVPANRSWVMGAVSRVERLTPVATWRYGTFAPATSRQFFAIDRDQTNCRDRVYELLAILMARCF
jgi:hypothetical protein